MALQLLLCLALLYGCASEDTDQRFAHPAQTFQTYKYALENRDFDLLWECFNASQLEGEEFVQSGAPSALSLRCGSSIEPE